jgi:hypothetical protein
MSVWNWRDVPLRKLAKAIKLLSVDNGGETVYVYLYGDKVVGSTAYRGADNLLMGYNTCSSEQHIVKDLIEAVNAELQGA